MCEAPCVSETRRARTRTRSARARPGRAASRSSAPEAPPSCTRRTGDATSENCARIAPNCARIARACTAVGSTKRSRRTIAVAGCARPRRYRHVAATSPPIVEHVASRFAQPAAWSPPSGRSSRRWKLSGSPPAAWPTRSRCTATARRPRRRHARRAPPRTSRPARGCTRRAPRIGALPTRGSRQYSASDGAVRAARHASARRSAAGAARRGQRSPRVGRRLLLRRAVPAAAAVAAQDG